MGLLRHGMLPSSVLLKATRARVLVSFVLAPLVLLAGCASDKPSYVHGAGSHQMAAVPRKVEIEDDGQPVQSPPVRSMKPEEDDPSQPWSPNYGKGVAPSAPSAPARVGGPNLPRQMDAYVPAPTPAAYRPAVSSTGSLTRLSDREADAVMTQAINAHEMRRQ